MSHSQVLTDSQRRSAVKIMLLIGIVGGGSFVPAIRGQAAAAPQSTTLRGDRPSAKSSAPNAAFTPTRPAKSQYRPNPVSKRAGEYYPMIWGVDSLSVKAVESGELIRFSYRIVDPSKATVFNDKKIDAYLDSPAANARLVIPSLEKVGQLRQYNQPEAGKSYWMAFSNPRRTVKRGDYVDIVIGRFRVDGVVVQ